MQQVRKTPRRQSERYKLWVRRRTPLLIAILVPAVLMTVIGGFAVHGTEPRTAPYDLGVWPLSLGGITGFFTLIVLTAWTEKVESDEAREQRTVLQTTRNVLYGGIAPGPVLWYLNEQHYAVAKYGRRLTSPEARERMDALCRQQRAAVEAQRRDQEMAAAALAFFAISNQLRTIERNQRRGI